MVVAKRLITKNWKARDPPHIRAWRYSLIAWAKAEGIALLREETLGLRKTPIATQWEGLLRALVRAEGSDPERQPRSGDGSQ